MNLTEYFEQKRGLGILGTADATGRVHMVIYARPHVEDDEDLIFLLAERKTYANLQENPHAYYLFKEDGKGFEGIRITLRKTWEEDNPSRTKELLQISHVTEEGEVATPFHLLHFHVEHVLPLVSQEGQEII